MPPKGQWVPRTPLAKALKLLRTIKCSDQDKEALDEAIEILSNEPNDTVVTVVPQNDDKETAEFLQEFITPQQPAAPPSRPLSPRWRQLRSCIRMAAAVAGPRRNAIDIRLMNWDPYINTLEFDAFQAMHYCTSQGPGSLLVQIGISIFLQYNFMDSLRIPVDKLANYLYNIGRAYHPENPYHNEIHACDVLQTCHIMLIKSGLNKKLSDIQILSLLMGAAVHDVEHPGLSNPHLVATQDSRALMYNDNSVLESLHASRAFQLLLGAHSAAGCNFLSGLDPAEFKAVKDLVISAVLQTDMKQHFQMLADLDNRLATEQDIPYDQIVRVILHAADISNPTKPWPVYLRWAGRVMREFRLQGEREKSLGIPFSPFCNPDSDPLTNIAKCQTGFIDAIVHPLFKALAVAFNEEGDMSEFLNNLTYNRERVGTDTEALTTILKNEEVKPTIQCPPLRDGNIYTVSIYDSRISIGTQCDIGSSSRPNSPTHANTPTVLSFPNIPSVPLTIEPHVPPLNVPHREPSTLHSPSSPPSPKLSTNITSPSNSRLLTRSPRSSGFHSPQKDTSPTTLYVSNTTSHGILTAAPARTISPTRLTHRPQKPSITSATTWISPTVDKEPISHSSFSRARTVVGPITNLQRPSSPTSRPKRTASLQSTGFRRNNLTAPIAKRSPSSGSVGYRHTTTRRVI